MLIFSMNNGLYMALVTSIAILVPNAMPKYNYYNIAI